MSNVTLNSMVLQLDVGSEPGIGVGCCMAPRYPLWCLDNPHTNLSLAFPPVTLKTDVLTMSFRVLVMDAEDGLVMLSRSPTSSWSLQLLQGSLELAVNVSGVLYTSSCPGSIADSAEWHHVEIALDSISISCSVDGRSETVNFSPPVIHSYSTYLLQLGGVSEYFTGRGFLGCFQRPRMNNIDIAISFVENGEGTIQTPEIHWDDFSVNTTDLVVAEHSTELLSSALMVHLPRDQFADHLTALYQLELERIIHFEVSYTKYGHLYIGHDRTARVEGFDYHNILATDPSLQVAYSHDTRNSTNSTSDVVVFRVLARCEGVDIKEVITPLVVSIEERDASLVVRQSHPLHLAVGTRVAITPDIVTVEDPVMPDPSLVVFRVYFVSPLSSDCSSCFAGDCENCEEGETSGKMVRNGVTVKFFNQEDVNRGVISFQHFARFSTTPLVIRLGVSTESDTDGMLDVTIPVTLYEGHLNLTSNPSRECVFVKEDGLALISPSHLKTITNFEDQDPLITYDLLTLPRYGILQLFEGEGSEWRNLANSTNHHTNSFGEETTPISFTQADVNNGHVRYVQSETISFMTDTDTFHFRVRSYNFSSNITAHLCINIVPKDILFQPTINVHLTSLVVTEGSSAHIDSSVFNTSLDKEGARYLLVQPDLDLQQLDVIYTLVDPPTFGRLELQGEVLVAEDLFAHRDVTSSALVYVHDGSEDHIDWFSFYGETGSVEYLPIKPPNRTSNLTLAITVTPVNDHPPLYVSMESIRPPEGCWVQVMVDNINVTDLDRPANSLRIYLKKKGVMPTGIFAYRSEPDRAIGDFYMQDILDQRVIFSHQLNSPLNYTQILRIDDGDTAHTIREVILLVKLNLTL
jgi:hypothetical protein